MQKTSDLYKELLSDYQAGKNNVRCQPSLAIGEMGADDGYDESQLISIKTTAKAFSEDSPTVGSCVSAQIDIEMLKPVADIPRQARLVPHVRLTDGVRYSEWLQKGVFYIDTRRKKKDGSAIERLVIRGFDDMLRTEQDYPSSTLSWPAKDIDVVREIADYIGVDIDPRTVALMTNGYDIQYPGGEYSCRETLGNIAALYGGNFIMNDVGQLRLLPLNGMPKPTRYLVDNSGAAITFGGVRILV